MKSGYCAYIEHICFLAAVTVYMENKPVLSLCIFGETPAPMDWYRLEKKNAGRTGKQIHPLSHKLNTEEERKRTNEAG